MEAIIKKPAIFQYQYAYMNKNIDKYQDDVKICKSIE